MKIVKMLRVYPDKEEGLMNLSDAAIGQLVRAMIMYQEEGTEPTLEGEAAIVWCFYRQMLDSENQLSERRAEAGRAGGKAKAGKAKANASKAQANASKAQAKGDCKSQNLKTPKPGNPETKNVETSFSSPSLTLPPADISRATNDAGEETENKNRVISSTEEGTEEQMERLLNDTGFSTLLLSLVRDSGIVRSESDVLDCLRLVRHYGEDTVIRAFRKAKQNHAFAFAYIERCCHNGLTPEPDHARAGSPFAGGSRACDPAANYHQRPVTEEINTADDIVEKWRREHPEETPDRLLFF